MVATDAGDGNAHDFVVWQRPRLVAPGRPELLLRDVREVIRTLTDRRDQAFASTAKYLGAAEEASAAEGRANTLELARKHDVDGETLRAWLDYLFIGSGGAVELSGRLQEKLPPGDTVNESIKGWGRRDTPYLMANTSDTYVRVPSNGNMKPGGVVVHPSPTLRVAAGWRSPVSASFRATATITPANPGCGNGVTWAMEHRRGAARRRLAMGVAQGSKTVNVGPIERVAVQAGDLVSLVMGPRDGNHACDATAIEFTLAAAGDGGKTWDLSADVSRDIIAANPHADRFGNSGIWHFYTEPEKAGSEPAPIIPDGSLVARWQSAPSGDEKHKLADEIQKLLTSGPPEAKDSPDAALYRKLASLEWAFAGWNAPRPGWANRPIAGRDAQDSGEQLRGVGS